MVKELKREDFVKWGRRSGEINKKKGKKFFSRIGKRGARIKRLLKTNKKQ